ncbi:MAG: HEAT repeat domain-containing protein [Armatimonadota bacterium]
MSDYNTTLEYRKKTTDELVKVALEQEDFNDYWNAVMVLHLRGTLEVFDSARELYLSEDENKRVLGIDILGQLGSPDRPFITESTEILLYMLSKETSPLILSAIATAIGQSANHDPRFVQPLIRLKPHEDAELRKCAAFGLSGYEDPAAIEAVIELSSDPDRDVRDYATHFGLDNLCGPDTPEIRDALIKRLDDEDDEIRSEAILGLAHRKDERVIQPLIKEIKRQSETDMVYDYIFEAAWDMADERLYPTLMEFKEKRGGGFPSFDDALIACGCVEEKNEISPND